MLKLVTYFLFCTIQNWGSESLVKKKIKNTKYYVINSNRNKWHSSYYIRTTVLRVILKRFLKWLFHIANMYHKHNNIPNNYPLLKDIESSCGKIKFFFSIFCSFFQQFDEFFDFTTYFWQNFLIWVTNDVNALSQQVFCHFDWSIITLSDLIRFILGGHVGKKIAWKPS